jgi:uncharacterized protein (DUF849 family)
MSTWLEVALNGPWSRERQPNIPIRADEIVEAALACIAEGAAIVHFHPYDEASGRQRDAYEIYAPIIERLRAASDAIFYGTLPFSGAGSAAQRFEAVDRLARARLVEWWAVDPGATHIASHADIARGREGFVYANPESHLRHGLALARAHRFTPSFAIYEPGCMRLGAALWQQYPGAPLPIYRLMFSQGFAFGFPPAAWALDAYLELLALEHRDAPWMVAGLGVEIAPLIERAVARGGHVRVGLEDAPLGSTLDNRALARLARERIEAAGGRLATPAEVRAALSRSAPEPG